jgi:hypothetical protein
VQKNEESESSVTVKKKIEVCPKIQVLIPKAAFGGDFIILRSLVLTIAIISTAYARRINTCISGTNINKKWIKKIFFEKKSNT